MSYIEISKINKTKTDNSPIYKKFKSVLNDVFEVPLESKISNPKFKIGCLCPELFERQEDIKSKLAATKFELMRKTTTSHPPTKSTFEHKNRFSQVKDFSITHYSNKDEETMKTKTERNVTIKTDANNNTFFSPKNSHNNAAKEYFSPSTTTLDRKLLALSSSKNFTEQIDFTKKRDSNKKLPSPALNMSKIPQTLIGKLERKFPDFVSKKNQNTTNNTSINDYQNKVKIRNMKEKVQKLMNK